MWDPEFDVLGCKSCRTELFCNECLPYLTYLTSHESSMNAYSSRCSKNELLISAAAGPFCFRLADGAEDLFPHITLL